MENNDKKSVTKTRKVVILLAVFFLAMAAVLGGVYAYKANTRDVVKKPDKKIEKTTIGDVLDENGMPSDGSDITEFKDADSERTLRELLLEDGKFGINLTKDIKIEESLKVNGTKKLIGDKSIVMDLEAKAFQAVLHVLAGSTLILDGATVDGSGIASGVKVEKKAGFTGLTGHITYPAPYGIVSSGTTRVIGLKIDYSEDIGICVELGSKAFIEGGEIRNCAKAGVYITEGAKVNMSGNFLIEKCWNNVNNSGECIITNGSLRDARRCLVWNLGKLTVDYQGRNANDKLEWYGAREFGIRNGSKGTAHINGLYIHDVTRVAVRGINSEEMVVTNCLFENTGTFGFESANVKQDVTLKNIEVRKSGNSGIRVYGENRITIENLKVTDSEGRGIQNGNSTLIVKDAVITNSKKSSVYGGKDSVTEVDNIKIVDSKWYGIENLQGTMTVKNATVSSPALSGVVAKKGSVTRLENLTVTNPKERGIFNLGGDITAANVTITSPGNYGVTSSKSDEAAGKVNITNLTVTGAPKNALNCNGSTLTVNGGTISDVREHGAATFEGGQLSLSGLEIRNCDRRGVYVSNAGSKAAIANTKISNTGWSGICVGDSAVVDLSDVTMNKSGVLAGTGSNYTASYRTGLTNTNGIVYGKNIVVNDSEGSSVYVNGGTLELEKVKVERAGQNGVYVSSSTTYGEAVAKISGLEITKPGNRGVFNYGGNVTISDVQIIKPATYGVTTAKLDNSDQYPGKVTAFNLNIQNVEKNNAINCNASVMTVDGGSIAKVEEYGANVQGGGELSLKGMHIEDCKKRGIYVQGKDTTAIVKNTYISQTGWSGIFVGTDSAAKVANTEIKGAGTEGTSASYKSGIGTSGGRIEISGVSVSNTEGYGVYVNGGILKGAKLGISDVGSDGVYVSKSTTYGDADVSIDGFTATKSKDNKAMNRGVYNLKGIVNLKNVNVKDLQGGIYSYGGTLSVVGGTIANVANQGIFIESSKDNGQVEATIEGISIQNVGLRGIYNVGSNVTLKDVKIIEPGAYGVTTGKVSWKTEENETITYTGEINATNLEITGVATNHAINCNASVVTVNGGVISDIKDTGIKAVSAGKVDLSDVTIQTCKTAIAATGNSQVIMNGIKIADTTEYDVSVVGSKSAVELSNVDIMRAEKNIHGSMYIDEGASLTLKNCSLTGSGSATTQSAIYVNNGNLNMEGGSYSQNVAATDGGVIYVEAEGNVSIKGTKTTEEETASYVQFKDNASVGSTSVNGGVLYVKNGGKLTASYCKFENNRVEYTGNTNTTICTGGVMSINSRTKDDVTVTNSEFTGNQVVGGVGRAYGGAVSVAGSCALTIADCAFAENSVSGGAKGYGGADVRVAASTVLYVRGKIKTEVFSTTAKYTVNVTEALTKDSDIRLKWDTVNAGTMINFTNADIMNASKAYISLDPSHSNYELLYSDTNATASPKKKN